VLAGKIQMHKWEVVADEVMKMKCLKKPAAATVLAVQLGCYIRNVPSALPEMLCVR